MSPLWILPLPLALLLAMAAARLRYSAGCRGRLLLDALFLLPLVIPPQASTLCPWNMVIVEALMVLPILYLCAVMGFRNVSPQALDAARIQGLGPCGTFWRLFIPVGYRWLLGGVFLVTVREGLFLLLVMFTSPCNV